MIDREKCDTCMMCAAECYANALRPVAKYMTIDEILSSALQDKGFYDNTGGGITVSGGEILMFADEMSQLIDKASAAGINVCLDTSGFGNSEKLMKLALKENVTHILFDIKSVDDEIHKEYTGVSNQLILRNLKMLALNKVTAPKIQIRMPLIKDVNDVESIIKRTGEMFNELGIYCVTLLPYHNLGVNKKRNIGGEQTEFETPSDERVAEIEDYFKTVLGMKEEILGKV